MDVSYYSVVLNSLETYDPCEFDINSTTSTNLISFLNRTANHS